MIDFNTEDFSKLSISELKRVADYWLRQYLIKDCGKYVFCPLKKRNFSINEMEVAHFIDRAKMSTRYDLDNCNLVSKQSNTWDAQIPKEGFKSLHHYDYEQFLGEKKVKELKEKSQQLILLQKQDYINIINNFKNGY